MNEGFWWSKQIMKSDDTFWHLLDKDTKKQLLGTYDEYLRAQKKSKKNFVDDEEGGEE